MDVELGHSQESEDSFNFIERKVLRKMYGAIKRNDTWRIRFNNEPKQLTVQGLQFDDFC